MFMTHISFSMILTGNTVVPVDIIGLSLQLVFTKIRAFNQTNSLGYNISIKVYISVETFVHFS